MNYKVSIVWNNNRKVLPSYKYGYWANTIINDVCLSIGINFIEDTINKGYLRFLVDTYRLDKSISSIDITEGDKKVATATLELD